MRDDPCFSCPLPECDVKSHRCAMAALRRSYVAKLRRGEKHLITNAERKANCFMFHIWKLARFAEASEGGRPCRRWERETAVRRRRALEATP